MGRQQNIGLNRKQLMRLRPTPKYFFSYANKFCKSREWYWSFNGQCNDTSNMSNMAEMLSTQYSSVFSDPKEEMEDPEVYSRMETIQNLGATT